MNEPISRSLVVHGASILLGFIALGWLLGNYAVRVKKFDRTVVVKGLSEREVPADVAIWPLTFQEASNDLNALFGSVQKKNGLITEFLAGHGIAADAITVGAPARHGPPCADPTATPAKSPIATPQVRPSRCTPPTSRRCARRCAT